MQGGRACRATAYNTKKRQTLPNQTACRRVGNSLVHPSRQRRDTSALSVLRLSVSSAECCSGVVLSVHLGWLLLVLVLQGVLLDLFLLCWQCRRCSCRRCSCCRCRAYRENTMRSTHTRASTISMICICTPYAGPSDPVTLRSLEPSKLLSQPFQRNCLGRLSVTSVPAAPRRLLNLCPDPQCSTMLLMCGSSVLCVGPLSHA